MHSELNLPRVDPRIGNPTEYFGLELQQTGGLCGAIRDKDVQIRWTRYVKLWGIYELVVS